MANTKVFRKLNSQEVNETWAPMVDKYGIKDAYKKQWIAEYCHYHAMFDNSNGALFESTPGLSFQTPNSINGMGAPLAPTRTANGSGDKFPTLLPVAMQVAAKTIAFDLVPVIPMDSPVGFLPYLDYVYAGGKTDTVSEPFLIKIVGIDVDTALVGSPAKDFGDLAAGQVINITADGSPATVLATLVVVGTSRIDGAIIFRVTFVNDALSINDVVATGNELNLTASGTYSYDLISSSKASLVSALENHVSGFTGAGAADDQTWTGNFYPADMANYNTGGMNRETAENATYRQMNLKMFTKWVEAVGDQVSISATVEQIQDLNRVWNYDVISMLENVGVNEISQSISKNIVSTLFKYGTTHANQLVKAEGANLKVLDLTAVTSTFENQSTFQRRLISRVMQVAQLIYHRGRFGAGEYVVTNGRLASAMMDNQGYSFNAAPMDAPKGAGQLYPMGKVYGLTIYVDPNLNWSDTRVLVGRKGADDEPGIKFLPYIMAESLQTISEATFSPKIAIKSRYAITEAGFNPQNQYFVFSVVDGGDLI